MKEMKLMSLSDEQIKNYNESRNKFNKVYRSILVLGCVYFGTMSLGNGVLGMRMLYLVTSVLAAVLCAMLSDSKSCTFTKVDRDNDILISNDWRLEEDNRLVIDNKIGRINDTDCKTLMHSDVIGVKLQ